MNRQGKDRKLGAGKSGEKSEFRHLVRIAGLDIDGNKKVIPGLALIKGIGERTAHIICELCSIDINKRIGHLSDEEVERIEKTIKELPKLAPSWVLNRRKDYETGKDMHLTGSDLVMAWREDITRLRRIRAYRGIRHELGLAVRGQRTRTWGRGKGATVGVRRKKRGGK